LVDGASDPHLARDLVAVVVHVLEDGRATAEVEVLGGVTQSDDRPVEVETSRLSVYEPSGDTLFEGHISEIEVRMPEGGPPSTVLYADGDAPLGMPGPVVPLHVGREIRSGSVRRRAGGSTARCVAVVPGLRPGSRVDLVTVPDPGIGGEFEVVEVWHRWDARGLWVEFVATA
jgi:hypothetical protein